MDFLKLQKEELIEIFAEKLLFTNRDFSYYINWDNIDGYQDFNIELNALNALIKNKNFDNTFRDLLQKLPSVITTFPLLIALSKDYREKILKGKKNFIILDGSIDEENFFELDFSKKSSESKLTDVQINDYLYFFEKSGLKNLFLNINQRSVLDYIIGVLVGLDSNGRKNRGGTIFELACTPLIESICEKYDIELLSQKKFKILTDYGFNISNSIINKKADFILIKDTICLNIEVNFYNEDGSKPKEIIGSYSDRQTDLKKDNIHFSLITDGKNCWGNKDRKHLNIAFNKIKYFMNYKLAKEGMLEETIKEVFLID